MKKILFVLMLSLASPAMAQNDADQALQKAMLEPDISKYPILEKLRGDDKKIAYDYLGQRFGVDCWLMSGPSLMQVVYTIPNQKTAQVGGALVGPDAEELSTGLMQDFMKKNPQRAQEILASVRAADIQKQVEAAKQAKTSPAEQFWAGLAGTGKITYGDKGPEIYALLDPAKPQTRVVWNSLFPLAEEGKLTLHVVPLALTTGDSIMAIATVLGDKDPHQAWQDLLAGKKTKTDETPDAKGVLGMKATVELAQRFNLRQLPLLVYRQGGKVRMVRGLPKDQNKFLKELGVTDR